MIDRKIVEIQNAAVDARRGQITRHTRRIDRKPRDACARHIQARRPDRAGDRRAGARQISVRVHLKPV